MGEPAQKRISENYIKRQNLIKEATETSNDKVILKAMDIAKQRHNSCRGVLGLLPITDRGIKFECCDCHEVIEVSALAASY